jgi:hypothetical protein
MKHISLVAVGAAIGIVLAVTFQTPTYATCYAPKGHVTYGIEWRI